MRFSVENFIERRDEEKSVVRESESGDEKFAETDERVVDHTFKLQVHQPEIRRFTADAFVTATKTSENRFEDFEKLVNMIINSRGLRLRGSMRDRKMSTITYEPEYDLGDDLERLSQLIS